jgi:rfaE bifunctional protein nucleotidyltransferase chain/domain
LRSQSKIKSLTQAARLRRLWRADGKRVVVTNGVFDVLHMGHVSYLQKARALGDVLIVGMNSDSSVRRLKGPLRPVVPQSERAGLLAALQCVDCVVIFSEIQATELLRAIQPDIYVKGGDYKLGTLDQEERRIIESGGGRVKILPLVRGRSTTDLIQTIVKRFGDAQNARKTRPSLDTVSPRR